MQVLGIEFQDAVAPLVETLVDEISRIAGGSNHAYRTERADIRGAVVPPTPLSKGNGVFIRIEWRETGAAVIRPDRIMGPGAKTRLLTQETLPELKGLLSSYYEQAKKKINRTPQARNPKWTEDELILALDQYFETPPWTIGRTHPAVAQLSKLLGKLSAYTNAPDKVRYRNPNGTYMKLMNFQYIDPSRSGRGLRGGGSLEKKIWATYGNDRQKLAEVAAAIRQRIEAVEDVVDVLDTSGPTVTEAQEGTAVPRLHLKRERDSALREEKKRIVLAEKKRLDCEGCGFNFSERYGSHGGDYIEVHHLRPLFLLNEATMTSLDELALVCANCHRMIHRTRQWLSIDELRVILRAQ